MVSFAQNSIIKKITVKSQLGCSGKHPFDKALILIISTEIFFLTVFIHKFDTVSRLFFHIEGYETYSFLTFKLLEKFIMKPNLVFLTQNVNENPSSIDRILFFVKDESCSCHKSLFKLAGINPDTRLSSF
jgi:hypothetical protein